MLERRDLAALFQWLRRGHTRRGVELGEYFVAGLGYHEDVLRRADALGWIEMVGFDPCLTHRAAGVLQQGSHEAYAWSPSDWLAARLYSPAANAIIAGEGEPIDQALWTLYRLARGLPAIPEPFDFKKYRAQQELDTAIAKIRLWEDIKACLIKGKTTERKPSRPVPANRARKP